MDINDVSTCKEMEGTLTVSKDGREVTVSNIRFHNSALQKIVNAIRCNGNIK